MEAPVFIMDTSKLAACTDEKLQRYRAALLALVIDGEIGTLEAFNHIDALDNEIQRRESQLLPEPLQQFAVAIGDTHLPTLVDQPVHRIAQYLCALGATTLLEYGQLIVKLPVGTRVETLLFRDDGKIVYVPGDGQCKK